MGPNAQILARQKAAREAAQAADKPSREQLDQAWAAYAQSLPAQPAPQIAIAGKNPFEVTFNEWSSAIGSQDPRLIDATNNILKPWMQQELTQQHFLKGFQYLDEKAKAKDGHMGGKDYELARNLLLRAYDIQRHQDKGETTLASYSEPSVFHAYLRTHVTNNRQFLAKLETGEAQLAQIEPATKVEESAPYGAYQGKTYAASDTPRALVREGQAYLQLIDPEKYNTGGKNSACALDASFSVASMDGICGSKTDAALRQFQKDQQLSETGRFDEATMAKLKELGAPKLAALEHGQQAASATPSQQPPAVLPTVLEQVETVRALFTQLNADGLDHDEKLKIQGNLEQLQKNLGAQTLSGEVKTQLGSVLTALKDAGKVEDTDQILGSTVLALRNSVEQARG